MEKKRIAMVCDFVPGITGGSYLSAFRFATLLKERGHHVILIGARDSGSPPASEYRGIPLYQFFAVATPGSHRLYFQSFPTMRGLESVFRRERIDTVHIMFPSYSCYVAKRVARKLDLALVAHIHTQPENLVHFLPSFLQTGFVHRLVLRYLIWFVQDADRIISPSELGTQQYGALGDTLPITVISNGVDAARFRPIDPAPFLARAGLPRARRYLLYVGRLMEEKGVAVLLAALPRILERDPTAHLLYVGSGPLLAALRERAAARGLRDHVTFLGKVSDDDLLAAYSAASLFILPSFQELEGMVVLEARASGLPILIADSPASASRFFVKKNGLLFRAGDPEDLAQKALSILTDDALRARMSAESAADARSFDIHQSVTKLEQVYEEAAQVRRERKEAAAAPYALS